MVALGGAEPDQKYYLPLVLGGLEVNLRFDEETLKRHMGVGVKLKQYRQDLKIYYEEWGKIEEKRKIKDSGQTPSYADMEIGHELLKVLEESEEGFDDYFYSDEDLAEKELEERFKEALAWRGPLLHGIAARLGNFEMRVYSNDHGQHFHVIHKGKRINARFSFPEIELINYKSQTTIGSKTLKVIQELCRKPEIFEKLQKEFTRRAGVS